MNRRFFFLGGATLFVAGCAVQEEIQLGPDGKPLPRVYRITPEVAEQVPFRFLDAVNALRQARGVPAFTYDSALIAAAETHSRDMAVQNRPWHFGSDGSSPLSRVTRAGYRGRLLGENISETYQTELETLSSWMASEEERGVILDPVANELGLGWFQEPNGKIWWTMITGARTGAGGVAGTFGGGVTGA